MCFLSTTLARSALPLERAQIAMGRLGPTASVLAVMAWRDGLGPGRS